MLQSFCIGNLGGDAELKSSNGREFVTFRVAHRESYNDANGMSHESVIWVDCIMNGNPNVTPYLKRGTQVFVIGPLSSRVYSSAKDRCMKAGLTINVQRIELLGGSTDDVPRRLYDKDGLQHDVQKYYHTDMAGGVLFSQRGEQFAVDDNGWCIKMADAPADVQQNAGGSNNG